MENFLDELELPKIDDIKFELDEWLSEESAEIPHSKGSEDIAEIRAWLEQGYIGRCDFYVEEIFKASYYKQYQELISLCKELGGRVAIYRNHAKVMVLLGERFSAVVESSANVNTNPRIENTIITVDSELADWYKEFFDGIVSFERNFDDVLSFQP